MIFRIVFILFISIASWATPNEDAIRKDLADDILNADFISLNTEERNQLAQIVLSEETPFVQIPRIVNERLGRRFDFLAEEPEQQVVFQNLDRDGHIPVITGHDTNDEKHSIRDLKSYIQNRIGQGTYQMAQNSDTKLVVVGGDKSEIASYAYSIVGEGSYSIFKIPSLYEEWGIAKFLISSNDKAKALIWVVPPSEQYLQHYAKTFAFAAKRNTYQLFDKEALAQVQALALENGRTLQTEAPNVDYVAFGYGRNWHALLKNSPDLEILKIQDVSNLKLSANIQIVQVQIKGALRPVQIALYSSSQTVWGELAATHLTGLLNKNIKNIFFLGSAGSVREHVDPYEVSVPKTFYVNQQLIYKTSPLFDLQNRNAFSGVHFDLNHGNTYSPLEQSRSFIQDVLSLGIDTLDVEQSLVAQRINQFNQNTNSNVHFMAINVITDKPIESLNGSDLLNDLDLLDVAAKDRARDKAVHIAIQTIVEHERNACKLLFKKAN